MSEKLLPCPFCGHDTPEFERMGDRRQSCIVICGWCGARHESSDEGDRCGSSWNQRAEPSQDGLRTALETALARIEDMLADDDGQAFKEARKFLPVGRAALAAQPGAVGEPVASVRVEGGMMRGATRRPGMASLPDGDHELFATPHTEAVRMSEAEIDDLPLPKEPDYDDKIKFARAVEQATAARLGVKMGDV